MRMSGQISKKICVIGGGLAGSELSFQLAKAGFFVSLYEPRLSGLKLDKAHESNELAELVCSNSLRSNALHNAAGLLKQELRLYGSLLISLADKYAVPAGDALAVSRHDFSRAVTETIKSIPNIKLIPKEFKGLKNAMSFFDAVCVCAGPLASNDLVMELKELVGSDSLYFYDAIAPLIEADSVDMEVCFRASRYKDQIAGDYVNCPLSREEYYNFIEELKKGDKAPLHEGDEGIFFRGCMPIEVMAEDAMDTLLNGPMRGDGLIDPRTGKAPYAAVQLRQDDLCCSIYNVVGFQTRLKYPEQDRIFRTIPGLSKAKFLRYGSMHRNTFIKASECIQDKVFLAGQLSGVEGYIDAIASAVYVSQSVSALLGKTPFEFHDCSAIASLRRYILNCPADKFQPMKINLGLLPPLTDEEKKQIGKKDRHHRSRLFMAERSINCIEKILAKNKNI